MWKYPDGSERLNLPSRIAYEGFWRHPAEMGRVDLHLAGYTEIVVWPCAENYVVIEWQSDETVDEHGSPIIRRTAKTVRPKEPDYTVRPKYLDLSTITVGQADSICKAAQEGDPMAALFVDLIDA